MAHGKKKPQLIPVTVTRAQAAEIDWLQTYLLIAKARSTTSAAGTGSFPRAELVELSHGQLR